jgi:hypothetical protein
MVTMDQITSEAMENTDTLDQSQAPAERTYTQKEFDDAMAKMKASVLTRALKPYQELGDVEELKRLKSQAQESQYQEQLKRGEFDTVIKELAAKKDAEIQKRDTVIKEYRVDTPLLNAAAKYRSVNPDQVKALLKNSVRLNDDGEVEIVGENNQVRYTDSGTPYSVDDLVKEFLDTNPHFCLPGPSSTNTKNSVVSDKGVFDVTRLDMSNPADRAKYAEWKRSNR